MSDDSLLSQVTSAVARAIDTSDIELNPSWDFDTVNWSKPGRIVITGYDQDNEGEVEIVLSVETVRDTWERDLVTPRGERDG